MKVAGNASVSAGRADGEAVSEGWLVLCEQVRSRSEGYAATDSRNAWRYSADAERFCERPVPSSDEELFDRHAEAAALREAWAAVFVVRPLPPAPKPR